MQVMKLCWLTRRSAVCAGAGMMVALAGCSSSLVGTWRATSMPRLDGSQDAAPDGAVTFASDGTYTSYMELGGQNLTDTGLWWRSGDELDLATSEGHREYDIELEGDELTMTERYQGERVEGTYRRVRP